MNYPYRVKVNSKDGDTIMTLNAKDIEDINRQAYNFVNTVPNSIIMTDENIVYILLSPDINTVNNNTKKNNFGIIGDGRNIQDTQINNFYERINKRDIIKTIAREHTEKYRNKCKFGKNCKFICKYVNCRDIFCPFHHF